MNEEPRKTGTDWHGYFARITWCSSALSSCFPYLKEKFPVGIRNLFFLRSDDVVAAGAYRGRESVDSVVELPRSASSVTALQNHALDMRVNVEGGRAQKTYERLVAVARQLDRKT